MLAAPGYEQMPSQPTNEFAGLLRRHRLIAGLSQEALAERAALSVRGISDLERGVRRAPHPATIARLADALGLDAAAREALLVAGTRSVLPDVAPVETPTAAAEPSVAAPNQEPIAVAIAPPATDERRWVTVLAVLLGGFAGLAQRLDPEDLHSLSERCLERISEEIRQLDGTVLHSTAETMLAVFGAPVAHEDDAERAVRAGLAIRDCPLPLPPATRGTPIQVRVGIETGEVLASLKDAEVAPRYAVLGAPASVADALANSGSASVVLVGTQTYDDTRHHVRYRESPPLEGPDWPSSLEAWEALDVGLAPRARTLRDTPFVGRGAELDVLTGALDRILREQRPHLVSVLGEAGIGKSRLIAEFERRILERSDVKLLHGRCLPYGETVGYRALAMALYYIAGITPDDQPEAARERLGQIVRETLNPLPNDPNAHQIERHLALLSGLATRDDVAGSPAEERSVHVSVRRFLEALARTRPICLLIEDVHWADDALLTLLEHVAERATAAPLLIVTQARSELLDRRPAWGGGVRAFTSLQLEPLDAEATRTIADALCRERGLSPEIAQEVSRAAGGNPLFAEELCAAMAEGGESGQVPTLLRPLISARLDALPAAEKRVLQYAAVLGKHVWLDGLAALAAPDVGGDLLEQLEALERRDLLRSQAASRFRGHREYAFKHDLIQEMAYGLLPRSERRRLHERIVRWLEQTAGDRIETILDLLAHHSVNAQLPESALDYLLRAAERAGRAAAHREATALLEQAIGIAETFGRLDIIPETHARRGRALTHQALWAEARRELEAAAAGLPESQAERRAEVLVDLALACNWATDTPALRERASQALELATSVERQDLAMDASFWLAWATGSEGDVASAIDQYQATEVQTNRHGIALAPTVLPLYNTALCWAGRFPVAVERGREAVRIAREAGNTDATILAMQVLGLAFAGIGAYDQAAQVFAESARFGREYAIGPFLARSIAMSAGFHLDVFDFEGHLAITDEASELARSVGFMPPLISASIDRLLNFARRGDVAAGEALERQVAEGVERAGAWHAWLWKLRLTQGRAELALARGDAEAAVQIAEAALGQARGRRPKYEVLALTTHAEALARLGRTHAALRDLHEAVGTARSVGDPALFVHAASPLLTREGSDALANEARTAATQILGHLPTHQMRQRFQSAEPVRALGPLASVSSPV
jgi:class 3 adenylate cyclase/tetratricopeptide (TPR) repeat protein